MEFPIDTYQPVGFDLSMIGKVRTTTKTKLLDAALHLVRAKGFNATSVDDICQHAGVSKGAFFHHFESKEHLALEAADHFLTMASGLFSSAPYQQLTDPLERLLGYLDFRIAIYQGDLAGCTCLLGTMVQETYDTHPAIRAACDRNIRTHANDIARDIEAARLMYAPDAEWTDESLSLHIQAVIQGSFILAKSGGDPAIGVESLVHLRRYISQLFSKQNKRSRKNGR